jgi:hypothetical protein
MRTESVKLMKVITGNRVPRVPENSGASSVKAPRRARPRDATSVARARRATWLLPLLGTLGCQSSGPVESDQHVVTAFVYGQVLTAAGAPVPGARVRANVHDDSASCRPGASGLTGGSPATSDAAGRYRQLVSAPVLPTELCVSVLVTPPAGSGLSEAGVAGGRVRLLPDTSTVRDSLRVDVRLP